MSFEWPSAATVSRSFHASGGAAPNTPSLPQFAPAARTWLIRASRFARKSGRLHVDAVVVPPVAVPPAGVLAAGAAGPGADEDASPPPPPHAATAAASAAGAIARAWRNTSQQASPALDLAGIGRA